MENHTVPVLRISQHAPTIRARCMGRRSAQISLNTAATATTVTPKLTQGPQSIMPAISAIAKIGKNERPITTVVLEKNSCHRRPMSRSPEIQLYIYPEQRTDAVRHAQTGILSIDDTGRCPILDSYGESYSRRCLRSFACSEWPLASSHASRQRMLPRASAMLESAAP